MTQKISFKKHLLTGISVVAFGAFMAHSASAANLAAAITDTDVTADDNTTNVAVTITDSVNDGNSSTVTDNGAGTQVITLSKDITLTGLDASDRAEVLSTLNDLEVIVVGTDDATIDITVNAFGIITSSQTSAGVLDINGTLGNITVAANGSITSTGENADVITIATGKGFGTLSNAGTIQAHGTGEAIKFEGTATITSLTNAAGGLIASSGDSALGVIDIGGIITGAISNAGTIKTNAGGIAIDVGANVTGGITNAVTGTISATTGTAINVSASTLGALTNAGTVQVTTGNAVNLATGTNITLITNSAGGLFNATTTGAAIKVAGISNATNISNSGTISASTTGNAILVGGALTGSEANGTIFNSSTGVMEATASTNGVIDIDAAVVNSTTVGKSIHNTGTIRDNGAGSAINIGAAAGIYNTNVISAAGAVDTIIQSAANSNATGITNTGTITNSSTGSAIDIATGAMTGAITNSGIIKAGVDATGGTNDALDIGATVTGGVINTGTIQSGAIGAASAIDVTGNATVSITNNASGALITSAGVGATDAAIAVTGGATMTGDITNTSGSITNTATTGAGHAIVIDGVLAGAITNSGTISSVSTTTGSAIIVDSITTGTTGITNTSTGIITSKGTVGTIVQRADADLAGDITNAGTISNTSTAGATSIAIDLSAATQTILITNSGAITGMVKLANTGTYTQTAGSLTNGAANTALLGTAGADFINIFGGTVIGNIDLGGSGTAVATNGDGITFGNSVDDSISIAGTINFDDLTVAAGRATLAGVTTGLNATSTLTVAANAILVANQNIALSGIRTINGELDIAAGKSVTGTGAVTIGSVGKVKIYVTDATTYGSMTGTSFSQTAGGTLEVDGSGITSHIANDTRLHVFVGSQARGTFNAGTVLSDNSYVYKFTQETPEVDDGFSVDIEVTRENSLASSSSGSSISSVGAALDSIGDGGDNALDTIVNTLESYSSAEQVEAAVKTLSSTVTTSGQTSQAVVAAADASIGTIENHMETARAEMGGTGVATGGARNNSGAWGQVYGSAIDQSWRKGVDGYQANVGGFAVGTDALVTNQSRVGAAFAYARTNAEGTRNEAAADSYQGSVYGTYDMGKVYYEGVGAFTYNVYDTKRTLFDNSVASADFNGQQYSAKATAGYRVDVPGSLKVTPFISAQYTLLHQDDATETGSNANLHIKSDDINIFKTGIGTNVAFPIIDAGITYTPRLSAAWYYDFLGEEIDTTSNFTSAAATTFISKGSEVAQNSYRLGAGLDVLSQDNVTLSLDYNWDTKENFNAHSGALKARFEF